MEQTEQFRLVSNASICKTTRAKQRCLFHLFAELRRVDQRNASIPWREARHRIQRLFQDAIRLKVRRPELEPHVYQRRKRRLHQRLDALIVTRFADPDATRLVNRLTNFRGETAALPRS